jgi:DNA polymerase-3 subunit gamma/tau
MFDNILGHEALVEELSRDVREGILPPSLLFYGPELSGKLTTALELARVLMCEKRNGAWGCECDGCRQNRLLEHPYLLILGARGYVDEIRAAADAVQRSEAPASRILLIRAVRKLEKRFDGTLWEGMENKVSSALAQLEELEDALGSLDSGVVTKEVLERIVTLSEDVSRKITGDSIPVHQIRKAAYWAHTTTGGSSKVVIFDEAERMLPGARNALLKTLEEPPVNTYFILLAARRESIIPTLKSRTRQFQFHERSPQIEREILRRVFCSEEYDSLKSFFLAWSTNPDVIKKACDKFYASLSGGEASSFFIEDDDTAPFLADLKNRRIFKAFLNELVICNRNNHLTSMETGRPDHRELERYESWNKAISRQLQRLEGLNMNPELLLDNLYEEMVSRL